MGYVCVCVCLCVHLAVNQREILALVHFFFTVAMWLMTHRQCSFIVLVGPQQAGGAAWQCPTPTRSRAGDQHHKARLTTEPRAGVCVCCDEVSAVVLIELGEALLKVSRCCHGGAQLLVCRKSKDTKR